MAGQSDIALRNQVIYSVFVRNHTEAGTFQALEGDLDRIQALGADILWLLPIHPIGKESRKGRQGSPYAIQNYREVNPEYGTKEEFIHLVEEIHKRDMKCMIDVVYNHTSPDSWLTEHHPEFFYKQEDGNRGNKVGDWSDVVDLDYGNKRLWDYLIETLCMWAEIVDGFRCDVASLVPLEFWIQAREAVERIRPGCIWLAESVYPEFVRDLRSRNFTALSDNEVYQAFDITYDYDVEDLKTKYRTGMIPLSTYVDALNLQDCIYPANYIKLRYLENHDQERAKFKFSNRSDLINWTAFAYFQKGVMLIYAGQERENEHAPSLFDYDKVDWNTNYDISLLLQRLYSIKKKKIVAEGNYFLEVSRNSETVVGTYEQEGQLLVGIFPLNSEISNVKVSIPNGNYLNLLDGQSVEADSGRIRIQGRPVIFEA
ncbi:alpha amylase [Paenibacillus sabinae T27]|uniref:Alpha amylase n=2 Tax=Paenibacillus sabinae TaxID=365617 RepID=X4ZM77_9BACL|nr:alpha amylase [Paenibacillus sabinae T27]